MSSRKKSSQPKPQKEIPSPEQSEPPRSNTCPKCGKGIFWLEFSGETYGGSYSFDKTHTLSFTCPECHYIIYQLSFKINQKDLRPTAWTVREEKKEEI